MLVAVVTPDGTTRSPASYDQARAGGPTAVKSGVSWWMRRDARRGAGGIHVLRAGYGYRVGLCQYGARNMAKLGMDYKEILAHYYPGTTVEKLTADALCWAQWKEACVDG